MLNRSICNVHATVKVGQSACNEWSPDKGRSLAFRAPAIEASAKAKADTCDAVGLHIHAIHTCAHHLQLHICCGVPRLI